MAFIQDNTYNVIIHSVSVFIVLSLMYHVELTSG